MYSAKGSQLLNNVARQSGLSKQLSVAHSYKSTAFLSSRNVSAGKLSYTTSRASQHLNKQSQDDNGDRTRLSRSQWQQLAKIAPITQHSRFNHSLATKAASEEATGEINNRIMQAAKANDSERVVAEFVAGRKSGVSMSTQTYDAVLDAYGSMKTRNRNQSVKAMCDVYDDMVANGVTPTAHAYATLIKTLCRRDSEVNKSVHALRHKVSLFGTGDDRLGQLRTESQTIVKRALLLFEQAVKEQQTQEFDVDLYNRMLNMLSINGNTKDALVVYEHLEGSKTANPNNMTFSMLISMYGYAGDLKAVHECFKEYRSLRHKLPAHDPVLVYNAYVFAHVDAGDLPGALELIENVLAKDEIRPTITTYNKIISGAGARNDYEIIDEILRRFVSDPEMPRPDVNTYGALLAAYCHKGDIAKATEMYEQMSQYDISKQYGRIADYVCLLRQHKQPERGLKVLQESTSKGLLLDAELFKEVLQGYMELNEFKKGERALESLTSLYAKSNFINDQSPIVNVAMDFATKSENLSVSVSVIRHLFKYSIKLNPSLASAIIKHYDAAKKDPALWEEFSSTAGSRDFGVIFEALFRTVNERNQFATRIFDLLNDIKALGVPITMPNLNARVLTRLGRAKNTQAQARWESEFEPFLDGCSEGSVGKAVPGSSQSAEFIGHSNAAVSKAVQGNLHGAVECLEKEVIQQGQIPKAEVVRDIIQNATRHKDLKSAERVYNLTKETLMNPEKPWNRRGIQSVLNSMLIAYARAEDVPRAKEFYDSMRAQGMVPDGDGYASLLACTPNSTADESSDAMDIYEEAMRHNVRPTVYFYNVIMSKLAKCRKIDMVLHMFEEMKKYNVVPNSITYAAVITACIKCSSETRAEQYFHEMLKAPKYFPRIGVFNSMIQFYTQQRPNREKALEYFHLLQRYNLQPSGHTYRLLMEVYANIPPYDMVTAHKLLTDMSKRHNLQPGPNHFATLIHSYGCLHRDVPSAVAVYKEMQKAEVKPDETVFQAMFNTYIENNDMPAAESLYKEMLAQGYSSSPYIENLFISGYGSLGQIDKAEAIWNNMADIKNEHNNLVREPSTYEAMVKAYLANNDPEKAAQIVKHMQGARNYPVKVVEAVHQLLREEKPQQLREQH
ncbi:hypothetical protein BX666DRAFT_1931830 [Dichotomocladium elegans]|nr:hypothetical protein BX666DRAFT_1931830 [Dichotomocladium elegans]